MRAKFFPSNRSFLKAFQIALMIGKSRLFEKATFFDININRVNKALLNLVKREGLGVKPFTNEQFFFSFKSINVIFWHFLSFQLQAILLTIIND